MVFLSKKAKIIFCCFALAFGADVARPDFEHTGHTQYSEHQLEQGSCQHQHCRGRRLASNTQAVANFQANSARYTSDLRSYEQSKPMIHGICLGSSALLGGLAALSTHCVIKRQSKDKNSLVPTLFVGLGTTGLTYLISRLIHKESKPRRPELIFTQDCFLARQISTVESFKNNHNDASFWINLHGQSWREIIYQINARFTYSTYPFIEANRNCRETIKHLRLVHQSAQELVSALREERDFVDGYDNVCIRSRSMLDRIEPTYKAVSTSHELRMDERAKHQAEEIERLRREQERLERERQKEQARINAIQQAAREQQAAAQYAWNYGQNQQHQAELERLKAEQLRQQKAWERQQRELRQAKQAEQDAQKIRELEVAAQQQELEYWKAQQEAQQKELDYWQGQRREAERQRQSSQTSPVQMPEPQTSKPQASTAAKQQAELDYWNEQKRKNDSQASASQTSSATQSGPQQQAPSVQAATAVEEADECSICMEEFGPGRAKVKLKCNHEFCRPCITTWTGNCPMCRRPIEF